MLFAVLVIFLFPLPPPPCSCLDIPITGMENEKKYEQLLGIAVRLVRRFST